MTKKFNLLCFAVLWFGMSQLSAEPKGIAGTPRTPKITVTQSDTSGAIIRLQSWKTPLYQVLDEIALTTGVKLHYSELPVDEVTLTCTGEELEEVLRCLLGNSVNLMFRYSQNTKYEEAKRPLEVWLLGSAVANNDPISDLLDLDCNKASYFDENVEGSNQHLIVNDDLAQKLLQSVKVDNPKQRANAISNIATKISLDNIAVREILLNAVDDESALVREQALFGLAYRNDEAVFDELQKALQDIDMSVRMKAVDLTEDKLLLQQAITDSDPMVRQLAQMKLEQVLQKSFK